MKRFSFHRGNTETEGRRRDRKRAGRKGRKGREGRPSFGLRDGRTAAEEREAKRTKSALREERKREIFGEKKRFSDRECVWF